MDNQLREIRKFNQTLAFNIEKQMGFLTKEDVEELVLHLPFHKLLVRCGNGRFVTAAQTTKWFVDIINKSKKDHVRDVSLLNEH
jgi:hypothetical protein